jgi:hypothetical protein
MPPDLKDWIKASARANRRSVNAEIVTLLVLAKEQVEKGFCRVEDMATQVR